MAKNVAAKKAHTRTKRNQFTLDQHYQVINQDKL
jgi:hypothetical protein